MRSPISAITAHVRPYSAPDTAAHGQHQHGAETETKVAATQPPSSPPTLPGEIRDQRRAPVLLAHKYAPTSAATIESIVHHAITAPSYSRRAATAAAMATRSAAAPAGVKRRRTRAGGAGRGSAATRTTHRSSRSP